MRTNEQSAKEIAATANECCHRSDGYEEAIESLTLKLLQEAYRRGYDACIRENNVTWPEDMGR